MTARAMLASLPVLALCFAATPSAHAGVAVTSAGATAAPRCAHPNVAARTLHAGVPESPSQVVHFGVGGRVIVLVSVAVDGHIARTRVVAASSRFLERTALAATRASRFAPAIRNCAAVGGDYIFVVDYSPPAQLPEQHADPPTYFPGTWHCATAGGTTRTLTFANSANRLTENDGSVTTSLTQDQYHVWRIRRNGRIIGWAFPWVDDTWTWSAIGTDNDLTRYETDDDTTFTQTTTAGTTPAIPAQTEKCTRASSP